MINNWKFEMIFISMQSIKGLFTVYIFLAHTINELFRFRFFLDFCVFVFVGVVKILRIFIL